MTSDFEPPPTGSTEELAKFKERTGKDSTDSKPNISETYGEDKEVVYQLLKSL